MTSYANLISTKQMLCNWLFLNNISKAHAHYLATLMTLINFNLFRCGHLLFIWKTHCDLRFHFGQFDRSEVCTEVSFTPPEVKWTLIMRLPHTEVKFYPQVKSQTSLIWVSWKRALILLKYETFQAVWTISAPLSKLDILVGICPWFWLHFKTFL